VAVLGKRVLIVVENLPVPFDRRVWMEATTLRSAGFDVSVISPTGRGFEATEEEIEGIHVYRHPLPPDVSSVRGYLQEYSVALFHEWRLAGRVRRRRGVDLVHICNPPDLLFLVAAWLKGTAGARVIYDQHDLNPEMYEAKYGRRDFFYTGLRAAEALTFRLADVVIATNESHREVALTRGGKAPEDVFVVRSGPDLSRFQRVAANPLYARGKKFLVGYVGVMGEPEGIDLLLNSVQHIVRRLKRTDVQFMLVGSGPKVDAMKALSIQLGLDEFVEFAGRVSDAELLERLSSADLCVAPDVKNPYNDKCTMNKVLEYMALGLPTVQFDLVEGRRSCGSAAEYAKANDPVDLGATVVSLLDDPDRRAKMGAEGRRRMVEELEWRHQAPRLVEAYDRALRPRS
jgi:glycosyltransferase involved in cell wall biosynthesis